MKYVIKNLILFFKLSVHLTHEHKVNLPDYYKKYINNSAGFCKECGKPTRFKSLGVGFFNFCSLNCARKSQLTKNKRANTNLERFGETCNFKTNEFKIQTMMTSLEKYGVTNPTQSDSANEKRIKTCLDRYNSTTYIQTKEFQEKTKKTNLEKHGVEHYTNREKANKTTKEHFGYECSLVAPCINKQSRKTFNKKYNCDYSTQNIDIKKKIAASTIKNHGGIGFAAMDLPKNINMMIFILIVLGKLLIIFG